MTTNIENKPFVSSLLPLSLNLGLQLPNMGEASLGEQTMCATTKLVANTILQAIEAFKENNFSVLDANPGDLGCQNRALEFFRLSQRDLNEEFDRLKSEVSKLKELLNVRMNHHRRKDQENSSLKTSQEFFRDHVVSIVGSEEMHFICMSFLSALMKINDKILPDGIVTQKSECQKLAHLSKRIPLRAKKFLKKILGQNQKKLSLLSCKVMQDAAGELSSITPEEKDLMVTMLSPTNCHTIRINHYAPKTFGCLFFEVKTLLTHLKDKQGLVCLKSIVIKGEKPFHIFFRSRIVGEEFALLSDEELSLIAKNNPNEKLVVFEAVVREEKENAARDLIDHGFTNCLLMQAAQEDPFEKRSTLEDIHLPEAAQEISDFRQAGKQIQFLKMDHVFLSTVRKELSLDQPSMGKIEDNHVQ